MPRAELGDEEVQDAAPAPVPPSRRTLVVREPCPGAVYVGRAGKGEDGRFGNPHADDSREMNVARFKGYFLAKVQFDPEFRRDVLALRGKTLWCPCRGKPCHADVIAGWLDDPRNQ